jgi:hypothetical protein
MELLAGSLFGEVKGGLWYFVQSEDCTVHKQEI